MHANTGHFHRALIAALTARTTPAGLIRFAVTTRKSGLLVFRLILRLIFLGLLLNWLLSLWFASLRFLLLGGRLLLCLRLTHVAGHRGDGAAVRVKQLDALALLQMRGLALLIGVDALLMSVTSLSLRELSGSLLFELLSSPRLLLRIG